MRTSFVSLSIFAQAARFVGAAFTTVAACSSPALAASSDAERALSVSGGAAFVTHKSKLVNSNDTGLAYTYGLRVLGGSANTILVDVRGSMGTTAFALNETSIATNDLVFLFGYNFGWGYVGAGAGTLQIAATLPDSALETYSRTYAGCLGTSFSLSRGTGFFLDGRVTSPFETKETQQQTVSVGLGMAVEAGATFDITRRALDLQAGVRYATQAVTFGGVGGGETLTSPFVSLRWGFDP
jgi:hypothetical protein